MEAPLIRRVAAQAAAGDAVERRNIEPQNPVDGGRHLRRLPFLGKAVEEVGSGAGHTLGEAGEAVDEIGEGAWRNWVQERGTYFIVPDDQRYTDLIQIHEPFEHNVGWKKGALVTANVGNGRWIFVGLGLWRQVAAGTDHVGVGPAEEPCSVASIADRPMTVSLGDPANT